MSIVALNRQFIAWDDKDPASAEMYARLAGSRYGIGWSEILQKSRVVILAEAGSGKSDELREQARVLRSEGKLSFYATVQDVALEGLPAAVGGAQREEFNNWKSSDQVAWFFIDSVDEAKLEGIRLEKAFQRIADAIEGARARAHIVLSGRYSDWEFRVDLARLSEILPIPPTKPKPEPPSRDSMLIAALRGERPEKTADVTEQPLVVLMLPLDADRVRLFAAAKGTPQLDDFMAAIDAANLWRFARRPLDLQWLVTYWKTNRHFGSLTEMLDTSLSERLREPNAKYARTDPLQPNQAMTALERIGAALVFGRADKLLIPDTEVALTDDDEFGLEGILPDWSHEHRQRLLTRAAFDPDTFGRVRLHNDNEGTVRSYLAARWLAKRRANAPVRDILALLFAEKYEMSLVRPSVRQTVAWLSIRDADVAKEVIARSPSILLNYGDPASLPLATRQAALAALTTPLIDGRERTGAFEDEALRRFSSSDLALEIHALWSKHKTNSDVRVLLLKMIAAGRLKECADIAGEAVFGGFEDDRTSYLGGRALLASADSADRQRFAQFITVHASELPVTTVREALEGLFPNEISVPALLGILSNISEEARDETLGLSYYGPRLMSRLTSRCDLEEMLAGLLDQIGPSANEIGPMETPAEKAYLPALAAAAHSLMMAVTDDEAPTVAIDVALRIRQTRHYRNADSDTTALIAELHKSATRRRSAFWRAAETLVRHAFLGGKPIENAWQLGILGWTTGLQIEDVEWLLRDASARDTASDRVLALNSAMEVWRDNDKPGQLLEKIRDAAKTSALLEEHVKAWLAPPPPPSADVAEALKQSEEAREKHLQSQAERDQSWLSFLADVRANPEMLRHPSETTAETIDGRIFHLWQLLESMDERGNRYAIDDIGPLESILGKEAADAFRDGLIKLWRQHTPILKSGRASDKRNVTRSIDLMGITAITLEANKIKDWPRTLSDHEAKIAAAYATLELNGFPSWFSTLAQARPGQVRDVLMGEIKTEVYDPAPGPRAGVLEHLAHGATNIAQIVAPALFAELSASEDFPSAALGAALDLIAQGLVDQREDFAQLAIGRFGHAASNEVAALYLGAAFRVDPSAATAALAGKLDELDARDQTRLVQRVLPRVFGDRIFRQGVEPGSLPPELLERLLLIAFRTIRYEDDNRRPNGVAYSPDERDGAERARDALFFQFVNTPGRAIFDGIRRMAQIQGFPISHQRLMEFARNRAENDTEGTPWLPGEAKSLEQEFDTVPRSPADLQLVAMRRLSDIQHDLLNADFAQGPTLKLLPAERDVQIWVANELQNRQGRAYSVERESHVVEEKAPDIRLRAKGSNASLPVEIKVAESWTREQLEDALKVQLGARYLRAQDAKHGVLLLVHQQERTRGWLKADGTFMSFSDLVTHLQALANIQASSYDAPQVRIALLDVSSLPARTARK